MSRSKRWILWLAPLLFVAALLNFAEPAGATFAGKNGLVAFVSGGPSGTTDIWTMHTDGTGRAQVTSTSDIDASPAWSPNGTKIAFVRVAAGSTNPKIWVMNANGSNQQQLTSDPNDIDQEPAWSPDGSKIVFSSNRSGPSQFVNDLYVMNADGSNVTRLTSDPGDDRMADWSPDGSKIAFVSSRSGFQEIWVMDAGGTNPTDLTNRQGVNLEPSWWPDGSKIVFTSNPLTATSTYDLYTIPAGGGSATPLFTTPANEFNPSPSPDGTMVFFDTNGAAPAGAPVAAGGGGTDVVGCDVPLTTCKNGGDGLDPSVQATQDTACPPIALRPLTLIDGVVGQKYGFRGEGTTIHVQEGTPPYTFGIADPSTFPPGMSFGPNEGGHTAGVSGRPTAPGTFTFTVEVADSTPAPTGPCHGSAQYTLVVHCAGPTIREREFDPATVGIDYFAHVGANGGAPPYTWSFSPVASQKPRGIGIDPATGDLRGVPRKEGFYVLRITVTDANGCVGFLDRGLEVAPKVTVKVTNEQLESELILVALEGRYVRRTGATGDARASAIAHDIRLRFAPIGGHFGRFRFILRNSTDRKVRLRVARGFVFCFSAERHKAKGEGWGAETCETAQNR